MEDQRSPNNVHKSFEGTRYIVCFLIFFRGMCLMNRLYNFVRIHVVAWLFVLKIFYKSFEGTRYIVFSDFLSRHVPNEYGIWYILSVFTCRRGCLF